MVFMKVTDDKAHECIEMRKINKNISLNSIL